MNLKEKELLNAISGTERMSGADSWDSEGDMSYFDGDDMSFAEGDMSYFDGDEMSFATGGNKNSAAVSDPYVIEYVNGTTGDLTAVIFGFNDNFGAANYGNPTGITITNLQGGTYGRLISQSNNKQFVIGKWRFQSASSSQLAQTLTIYHYDANGKQYQTPLNLSIMRDAYQQQSDILDVTKPVTVDANTQITFTLKAATTLTISMFPVAVLSAKAKLNGGNGLNTAKSPRLSGKNVSPVIIQTNQGVGGVRKS